MTISNAEPNNKPFFDALRNLISVKNFLTSEECDKLIKLGTSKTISPGQLRGIPGQQGTKNSSIRKGHVSWIHDDKESEWLFIKLQDMIEQVNQKYYRYHIDSFETLQFTIYDEVDDHYELHLDAIANSFADSYRKFSFSIQLSDTQDYQGSDLEFMLNARETFNAVRDRGTLIIFSSMMWHKVTPLISGKRYSLVGWVQGKPFT